MIIKDCSCSGMSSSPHPLLSFTLCPSAPRSSTSWLCAFLRSLWASANSCCRDLTLTTSSSLLKAEGLLGASPHAGPS